MTASTVETIRAAIAQLGDAPLDEERVRRHVRPLFARVLHEQSDRVYLANHSLGRPLDAVEQDVREALAGSLIVVGR